MSGETILHNIDLAIRRKERYTINGDEDKFVELNVGDVGIIARYAEAIPKINEWINAVETLAFSSESEEESKVFADKFKEADADMRTIVNGIFDYDVCAVCLGNDGSMFDLSNGEFVFEVIIETLFKLYDETITAEQKKLQNRIKKHTDKYLPQDRKKKS